jgi:hypothetical protein
MEERKMPDPSEHTNVRRWHVIYELGRRLGEHPDLEMAMLTYKDGIQITVIDGVVRVSDARNDFEITLDQIPGYIKALEGDVLQAQEELRGTADGSEAT